MAYTLNACYGRGGRLFVLRGNQVDRYDDAAPPAVAASVTLSGVTALAASIMAPRPGGQLDIVYTTAGKQITSRDDGATWAVSSNAMPAGAPLALELDAGGIQPVVTWVGGQLKLAVALLETAGTLWAYPVTATNIVCTRLTPLGSVLNVAGVAQECVGFQRLRDGSYVLFSIIDSGYSTYPNSVWMGRTRNLKSDGTATWAFESEIIPTGSGTFSDITAHVDEGAGLAVVVVRKSTITVFPAFRTDWQVVVGALNSAGNAWAWSTPQTLTTLNPSPPVLGGMSLLHQGGTYTLVYMNSLTTYAIKRCRNLKSDGTGDWA